MDDTTILGSVFNQLGQTAKQTVKQVVKLPEEMARDAGEQIGSAKQDAAENKASDNRSQWQSDEERIKFLKDLYGPSPAQPSPEASAGKAEQDSSEKKPEEKQVTSANPLASATENKKPTEFQEQIADKSPEEQKQLMELRNQLHKENYYDPTFNPVKKQEERPAEKVENEKKLEMQDLQQKNAEKPPPIAVQREQNKAEMFRGASG